MLCLHKTKSGFPLAIANLSTGRPFTRPFFAAVRYKSIAFYLATKYKENQRFTSAIGGFFMPTRLRLFIAAVVSLSFTSIRSFTAEQQPAANESATRAVINQYCAACHNDTSKSGSLSLAAISAANPEQNPEIWEKVVRKLRGRMMPPPGRPRPDERTYDEV